MIKNNIKIAWRSLKKSPFFTFLNTFGLAIGMAGGLLIGLYIYDELNFDNTFADFERIHRVNVDIKFGGQAQEFAVSVPPMAAALKKDFSQIEESTRFRTWGSMLVRRPETNENQKEEKSSYADSNFMKFFGIKLLEGDIATALVDPNTVVLSETAAKKYFGDSSPLGKSILINNEDNFKVTGVIPDMPKNSFLRNYSVFMAMEGYEESKSQEWGSNNFNTFIKLIPSVKAADLQEPLQIIFEKYMVPWAASFMPGLNREQFEADGNYIRYSTVALSDLHLASNRVAEMNTNSDKQNIYILSFIALFLITLACVNFMNLSTAQSLKRAKEVGIRKTLGSNKLGLVRQFLTESSLISFLSLILALFIAIVALPYFNLLAGKEMVIPYSQPLFWLTIILSTLLLGLFSGSYPAFFLSRFLPVKVLKGGGQRSVGGGNIRNSLVVFQFAISVFLIISTLVVFQQLKFIQDKDLGFQKDQILIIDDVYAAGNSVVSFKEQVSKLNLVEAATLSSFLPTPSNRSDNGFELEGTGEENNTVQMQSWAVDHDYAKTLNLEMVTGRFFDKSFSTDTSGIIINETALSILGLSPEEAIGKRLSINVGVPHPTYSTIIGVVKNFHFESFKDDIGALSMHIGGYANKLTVKLKAGDFKSTIAEIEDKWEAVAPGQPFNFSFMDDSYNSTYESEQRLGSIFFTFTILSLLIACLGLFGLAAFNAEKRTKEIGVRKVMGASVSQISYRLTIDFLKLVGVAIVIALPLGWYVMNKWLEDFSYRIEIPVWIYILAAISAICISILTVSYQSINAAIVDPVKSLKSE
ncbi:putative ABC transport system permease protein [Spirosomataceae bacterium TFI 002]|nr:putative ABC transport system permease protein [Spirosomataceae bacterium TFI 002]